MSRTKHKIGSRVPLDHDGAEPPPLTRTQIRELNRRVCDSMDPTRYLLATALTTRHVLFYNVTDDVFAMDDPTRGTLFKRREAAMAIKALLTGWTQILQCRVTSRGRLVLRSVPRVRPRRDKVVRPHGAT